jgi:hypothetical protein
MNLYFKNFIQLFLLGLFFSINIQSILAEGIGASLAEKITAITDEPLPSKTLSSGQVEIKAEVAQLAKALKTALKSQIAAVNTSIDTAEATTKKYEAQKKDHEALKKTSGSTPDITDEDI